MKRSLHIKHKFCAFTKITFAACSAFLGFPTHAQIYIHPNQAGYAGGNTTSPGVGSQIVVSTYLGTASTIATGIQGTVFVSDKNGNNKFAIADFAGFPNDGSFPFYTTPQQMSDGNLYGTSFVGGSSNLGTVYKYDLTTGPAGCEKTIVHNNSVGSSVSGVGNYANVNELSDGKLYIAYSYGGALGYGQIIRMNKDGTGIEVLKNFSWIGATVPYTTAAQLNANDGILPVAPTSRYDGAHPYGFVVEGADGKVYGTCIRGGTFDVGVVWRMNKDGSSFEIIHACDSRFLFTRLNGFSLPILAGSYGITIPWGNVAQDQLGRIYLTGYNGGESNLGGLGRMNADGSNFQVLTSGNTNNGANSYRGPLIIDNEVFGTYRIGGSPTAVGVVWKYNILTNAYTKLKTFESSGGFLDGYDIWAGVAFDGTSLFGTAIAGGGPGNIGTLWKIKPDGTEFEVLHRFSSAPGPSCGVGSVPLFSYYPSAERVTFATVSQACSETCIDMPLPVSLTKFEAIRKHKSAYLEWTTMSEQNNLGFEIERSADGIYWSKIGFVPSKSNDGSSNVSSDYNFTNYEPLTGRNFFRLKQVDFDGKYMYSQVRLVKFDSYNYAVLYPNPVRDQVTLTGMTVGEIINIYDVSGRKVKSMDIKNPTEVVNLETLNKGIYLIYIIGRDGEASSSYKVVKD